MTPKPDVAKYRIMAALGNGANETAWKPGEDWVDAAIRAIDERAILRAKNAAVAAKLASDPDLKQIDKGELWWPLMWALKWTARWLREDVAKLQSDLEAEKEATCALREALDTAREAMRERRAYCDAWEWKYAPEWDQEDATVDALLVGRQKPGGPHP